jgi:FdrA protein
MTDTVVNRVRSGFYMDSVALMRFSRSVVELDGVEDAALMMGTPANREIMENAGLLSAEGAAAEPGDLVIAVRAANAAACDDALAAIDHLLARPAQSAGEGAVWAPRTIRAAVKANPAANLALISVPGDFAASEARKALRRGLHVMIFSDNVTLDDEIALKKEAKDRGLLMMGPDCGTAILNGVPIAFANNVRRGNIGIVGASGTGIQEVSCQISRRGGGISHAIGVGGRDLKEEVGGISTLMAMDALDIDPTTDHIVVISKPPAAPVAASVIGRAKRCTKSVTICFIGDEPRENDDNVTFTSTLKGAAESARGGRAFGFFSFVPPTLPPGGRCVRGLYSGGTLAAEAQSIFLQNDVSVASNAPVPGAIPLSDATAGTHVFLDLGDDQYTRGRPHPMIEPAVRQEPLQAAIDDPSTGIILVDIVIGHGSHPEPAGELVDMLQSMTRNPMPVIIASVTGTDEDPQCYSVQSAILREAGIIVAPSNADVVLAAMNLLGESG